MKKRKDGRYCKQVLIGYSAEGKPRYKNIYGRTQAETIHAAELFRNELEKGVAVIGNNFILSEWSDRWLELYKSNVEYNTYKMYSNAVNKHIKPYLGHMNLKDIKTHHVQELLNILIKAEKFRTCGIVKLALSQIMNQACENEYIYKNPVKNVKIPKTSATPKRALSEEELHWLHIANFTEKQKAFVFLLLNTGLRRGEALALTPNDIDLKNKTITVEKALIYKENEPVIKPCPKSNAGFRSVPIPNELCDVLAQYLKSHKDIYLFPAAKGGLMSKSSFRKFWDSMRKAMNEAAGGTDKLKVIAKDITPHLFRHTYATRLYYAGVDIKTAQYLLGHSSIQMTLDIYTHLDGLQTETALQKLNAYSEKISQKSVNQ